MKAVLVYIYGQRIIIIVIIIIIIIICEKGNL